MGCYHQPDDVTLAGRHGVTAVLNGLLLLQILLDCTCDGFSVTYYRQMSRETVRSFPIFSAGSVVVLIIQLCLYQCMQTPVEYKVLSTRPRSQRTGMYLDSRTIANSTAFQPKLEHGRTVKNSDSDAFPFTNLPLYNGVLLIVIRSHRATICHVVASWWGSCFKPPRTVQDSMCALAIAS
ncbi:hypothetical protein BJX61DRAFT_134093 [Aspergillus egyptiacus]|nr:hypothetical protein BJX61DRAFT_134093 [Aspergillus egyptiacus]